MAAWRDLALILGAGLRRRPSATKLWTLLTPLLLLAYWPVGAPAGAATGGVVLGMLLRREERNPLPWCVGFLVLAMATFSLRAPLMSVEAASLWGACGLFVGGVIVQTRSRRLFWAAFIAVPPVAVVLIASGLLPHNLINVKLGHLIVFIGLLGGGLAITARRPERGALFGPVMAFASAVSAWLAFSGPLRPGLVIPLIQALLIVPAVLFACAVREEEHVAQRAEDALGRLVHRLHRFPLMACLVILAIAVAPRWIIGANAWGETTFAAIGGWPSPDEWFPPREVQFVAILVAPLSGAFLGRVLKSPRDLLQRCAPAALCVVTFTAVSVATLLQLNATWPFPPETWLPLIGVGGLPAAWAALVAVPQGDVKSSRQAAMGFGTLAVLAPWAVTYEWIQFGLLLGLGYLYRVAMDVRPRLALVLLCCLGGLLVGFAIKQSIALALGVQGATLRSSVNGEQVVEALRIVLVPVFFAWPTLAIGRRLGSATAVPKEHPIYADFDGPQVVAR